MITIVLSNYSSSWCRNKSRSKVELGDTLSSTGYVEQTDTLVSVPISTLKIANSKMIELKYEKEINTKLKNIIVNDSLVISGLNLELDNTLKILDDTIVEYDKKLKQSKKERNVFIITTISAMLVSLLVLVK